MEASVSQYDDLGSAFGAVLSRERESLARVGDSAFENIDFSFRAAFGGDGMGLPARIRQLIRSGDFLEARDVLLNLSKDFAFADREVALSDLRSRLICLFFLRFKEAGLNLYYRHEAERFYRSCSDSSTPFVSSPISRSDLSSAILLVSEERISLVEQQRHLKRLLRAIFTPTSPSTPQTPLRPEDPLPPLSHPFQFPSDFAPTLPPRSTGSSERFFLRQCRLASRRQLSLLEGQQQRQSTLDPAATPRNLLQRPPPTPLSLPTTTDATERGLFDDLDSIFPDVTTPKIGLKPPKQQHQPRQQPQPQPQPRSDLTFSTLCEVTLTQSEISELYDHFVNSQKRMSVFRDCIIDSFVRIKISSTQYAVVPVMGLLAVDLAYPTGKGVLFRHNLNILDIGGSVCSIPVARVSNSKLERTEHMELITNVRLNVMSERDARRHLGRLKSGKRRSVLRDRDQTPSSRSTSSEVYDYVAPAHQLVRPSLPPPPPPLPRNSSAPLRRERSMSPAASSVPPPLSVPDANANRESVLGKRKRRTPASKATAASTSTTPTSRSSRSVLSIDDYREPKELLPPSRKRRRLNGNGEGDRIERRRNVVSIASGPPMRIVLKSKGLVPIPNLNGRNEVGAYYQGSVAPRGMAFFVPVKLMLNREIATRSIVCADELAADCPGVGRCQNIHLAPDALDEIRQMSKSFLGRGSRKRRM